jgi:hypothetical protein
MTTKTHLVTGYGQTGTAIACRKAELPFGHDITQTTNMARFVTCGNCKRTQAFKDSEVCYTEGNGFSIRTPLRMVHKGTCEQCVAERAADAEIVMDDAVITRDDVVTRLREAFGNPTKHIAEEVTESAVTFRRGNGKHKSTRASRRFRKGA